jgi:hypothetical protein
LEFGPPLPPIKPLKEPSVFIAGIATGINEVITGLRPVDQLHGVLNEFVYESLKRRANSRAQARLGKGTNSKIPPKNVLRVRYQSPAEGVIESVVLLDDKQRSQAVTIRLEAVHNCWRATNIGFI